MHEGVGPCCAASRGARRPTGDSVVPLITASSANTDGMVLVDDEEFLMGSDHPKRFQADGEGPVRKVVVDPFYIDATAVDELGVHRVRRRDRLPDRRREVRLVICVLRADLGRGGGECRPGGSRGALVVAHPRCCLAQVRRALGPPLTNDWTTLSSTSPGTTPPPTADGPENGFLLRRSGRWRLGVGWTRRRTPGGTS